MMVDDPPNRPFADDPDFLDSLAELDRNLSGGVTRSPSTTPPEAGGEAPPSDRRRLSAGTPRGPRPLLDLFPTLLDSAASASPATQPVRDGKDRPATVERPFAADASDLRYLFQSDGYERASHSLLDALRRRDGVAVVTGVAGVGKTMLVHAVLAQLDRRARSCFVSERVDTIDQLLQMVLTNLGVTPSEDLVPGRHMPTYPDPRATLRAFLESLAPVQAFAVVVVDNAHELSAGLLNEVPQLIEKPGAEQLLQVILVGRPTLVTTLGRSETGQLARRISLRCAVDPLTGDEVGDYVQHRLVVGNSRPGLEFDGGAIDQLVRFSGGVPGTINRLCDRALAVAASLSISRINDRLVESAAEDLDVTPAEPASSPLRLVAIVVVLIALMAAGAAAAAYVFRAELSALWAAWRSSP